jgi:hypothetical protein
MVLAAKLYPPEDNTAIRAAETEGVRQGNFVVLPAGNIGHHIHVGKVRIGNMIDRRQNHPLLHAFNGQGIFDGGSGTDGVADLRFV